MFYKILYKQRNVNLNFLKKQIIDIQPQLESSSPNIVFFKNRLHYLVEYEKEISILQKKWKINNKEIIPTSYLSRIKYALSKEKILHSILTQGDPTLINLLNNGTIIDYEAAGMNSIVGETAIFLSNLLFSSYYFFLKYPDGEYINHKDIF